MTAVAIATIAFGCVQLKHSHENFKDIVGQHVGKNIWDLWARRGSTANKFLLSVREVGGGHKEYEYQFRGECRYFYEVNENGTIVAWRYTGPESDCVIFP